MTNSPTLTTGRIVLRQLAAEDAAAIFFLRSNEKVNEFLDRPKAQSREDAASFIQKINAGIENKEWFYWAIALKEDPASLIGTACLWNFSADRFIAEIGYELHPSHQRKGIMQEAVKAVIDYAFNKIKLKTIKAYTHVKNTGSSRLLEKLDFKIKLKHEPTDGNEEELRNILIYILHAGEA